MERTLSSDLEKCIGKRVCLRGWFHSIRSLGKVHFLLLRDRAGLSQVVIEEKELFEKLKSLQVGSILKIFGNVAPSQAKDVKAEIVQPEVLIEVPIHESPVIEYNKPEIPSDLEFILDHRPLSLRNREIQAIFKVQAELTHAYRLFMHDEMGAVEYFAPNLIGASSEGGAEFFTVDYFGHTATLAQSSQLYKQMLVGAHERVFALMPFFRKEPSHTTRHLAEGKQFEFEMGFFSSWEEIMDVQERCIHFLLSYVAKKCQKELHLLGDPLILSDKPIPRLSFQEAQELYYQRTGLDERQESDLSPAAEKDLCQWALQEKKTPLLFITDWKVDKRPFYAFPNEKNPQLTNTFDLLYNGIEITSGGQRRHTYPQMLEGLKMKGMEAANFSDYLSVFRYGMPPHGGFGMGLERLTMTLLKRKNIREVSLFPSDTKRIAGVKIKAHIFFGGENIRNEILRLAKKQGFLIEHLVHAPTPTSEDSAKVRKTSLEEGIKALILRGKNTKKNFQFNIPSHLKIDMKAVADIVGEKCEFEDPHVILERYGLKVGGVPPFGNLLGIDNYFDKSIESLENVAFNVGLSTESIVMKGKDLLFITSPKWGSFIKRE